MPMPRKSDAYKKRIGTYRADRSENAAKAQPENEALSVYREIAREVLGRAIDGDDVSDDIAYLREAESVLQSNGVVAFTGQKFNMSGLIDLTMQAAKHWH